MAPSGCESRTGHGSMLFVVFSTQFLVWRDAEVPYCLSISVLSYIIYPSFSNNLRLFHFWTNSCHFIERQKSPVVKAILFLFKIITFFYEFYVVTFSIKSGYIVHNITTIRVLFKTCFMLQVTILPLFQQKNPFPPNSLTWPL